jgi:enoyl-CoA hydratase
MELKTIIYEKKDNVGWITLNRPEARNAQNDPLRAELISALNDARTDNDVILIVITGSGDKAFSAGADISEFPTWTTPMVIQKRKGIKNHYETIRDIPKPVIAMVNGVALGGGCELAMACDIIIASETAKFGQPEVNVGVIPGGGGTQMLPRLVGEKKAKELVFTGDLITAQEALQLGLINKVVPADKLKEAVEELIKKIKSKSPIILKLAKLSLNKSLETPLSVGLTCETDYFAMCFGTEDQKEASKAFLEKRTPKYSGK